MILIIDFASSQVLPLKWKLNVLSFYQLGYVSKNGLEWDSNPCPHQPETYSWTRSRKF